MLANSAQEMMERTASDEIVFRMDLEKTQVGLPLQNFVKVLRFEAEAGARGQRCRLPGWLGDGPWRPSAGRKVTTHVGSAPALIQSRLLLYELLPGALRQHVVCDRDGALPQALSPR
ncbi:hypothetical protein [Microbulbifer sp. SAOS-129_SWC]|uniref:hypothetical protein n=1 Tax=Microbulbifer sp. SAOS-129_SWC TaxID=3145235 RepID=UPI0032163F77